MKGILIKGKNELVGLSAYNYYGANFTVDIFDQNSNSYVLKGVNMVESVEPVEDFSTKVAADTPKDSDILQVNSIDGLNKSDRVSIDGEIYRVIDIISENTDDDDDSNDTYSIKLHRPLVSDVTADTDVTRVGNMGLYYVNLFLTKTGVFVIQAKDSKYGIQHSEAIEVKAMDIETMYTNLQTDVEEGVSLVQTNTGWSVLI